MLIVCPSCASEYVIDIDRLGAGGRRVRCASCRETWHTAAEVEPILDPPQSSGAREPDPEPAIPRAEAVIIEAHAEGASDELPQPAPRAELRGPPLGARSRRGGRRKSPVSTGRAASVTAATLSLLTLSAIAFRPFVVRMVPETGSLFQIIGLPVNLVGLTLADVASALTQDSGATVLVVEGRISNVAGRAVRVPPLDLKIEGERGAMLYSWTAPAGRETLAAGETMPFRARLSSPPPAGRRVLVTFETGTRPREVASR